jgi:hypothetical protein
MSAGKPAPHSSVRRVITGHDERGRAVVLQDEIVRRDKGALSLWGMDAPTVAGDGTLPQIDTWWPAPGGVRVSLSTRAPESQAAEQDKEPKAWPNINDAAGFHASNSTDIIVMISGKLWLELDDGKEVELNAGDVLIQNGTRHRWHNHSDDWPLYAVIIVGAQPAAG